MKKNVLLVAAAIAVSGCVSERPNAGLGPNSEGRLTIVQAVENLITDPTFAENYARAEKLAKDGGKSRPAVTILPIENNADSRGDSATRQMYRRLQTEMRKTRKFEIVDPAMRHRMVETVVSGTNNGESGEGVQSYGDYHAPDFVMQGELVREEDGEKSLNLNMTDVRTGAVFWSEVVTPSDALNR